MKGIEDVYKRQDIADIINKIFNCIHFISPYIPVLTCMTAGLMVVLFLPENFFYLFPLSILNFNSRSFVYHHTTIKQKLEQ